MQGVCSFLDIEFDRRMVSLKDADRSAIYDGGHHEMVNSEKIVAGKKKPEVLPEDIRHKVACYIAYWKRESGGSWPLYPLATETQSTGVLSTRVMFFFEYLVDRLVYRGLRMFDQFVALVYSYLPLGLLRRYRASKGRTAEPVPQKRMAEEELVAATSQKH
jgi:hypothetical protein